MLVLSIGYKGKPTHHLIDKNEAGVYGVNGKLFGLSEDKATSAKNVLLHLSQSPPGWPAPFKVVVTPDGSTKKASEVFGDKGNDETHKKKASSTSKPWLHSGVNKEKADQLLDGKSNGMKN